MIRPQQFSAKLADKLVLNPKFTQLFFEVVEPHHLEFEAGQYISIALPPEISPTGERRSYSICSSPEKDHGFELLVEMIPGGKGTSYLNGLELGQEIHALAPLGMFTVKEVGADQVSGQIPAENSSQTDPLIFVATGSGVAPFRSMIEDQLQQKKSVRDITLYWGLRHVEDLCWEDEFEELAENFGNFHFHPVISQPLPTWPLCRGRVTDCVSVHELPGNANFYLCGSTNMIEDMFKLLETKNVPKEKIHREKFF